MSGANNNYTVVCSVFSCTLNKYRPDPSKLQENWNVGGHRSAFVSPYGAIRAFFAHSKAGVAPNKASDPSNDLSIDLDYSASAIDLVYLCQKAASMAQYRPLIHGAFVRDFAVVK